MLLHFINITHIYITDDMVCSKNNISVFKSFIKITVHVS